MNGKYFASGKLAGLILLMVALGACERETVRPGEAGIKVYLTGSNTGKVEKLGVGRHWEGYGEEIKVFPITRKNYLWTKETVDGDNTDESINFQSSESATFNADVSIVAQIEESRLLEVYQTYKLTIEELIDGPVRNVVKDELNKAANTMRAEDITGPSGKVKLKELVEAGTISRLAKDGITVYEVNLVNEFRLPAGMKEAILGRVMAAQDAQKADAAARTAEADGRRQIALADAKARTDMALADSAAKVALAQAKAKLEIARAEASARIANAEAEAKASFLTAKAEADGLRLKGQSITKTLVDYEKAQRWNGKLPMQFGGGGNNSFLRINGLADLKAASEE